MQPPSEPVLSTVDQRLLERRRSEAHAYQLVAEQTSKDVIEALEELLTSAKAGVVQGIAFGAILKGRKFLVDCAGTACTDPTLTRGVIATLDDELRAMVHARVDRSTTL